MTRANRQYFAHGVWHITQRCHDKKFLLRFALDRDYWRLCLFEACRRYEFRVLNYIATSNHVHLIVACDDTETVPRAMQYISGRTAQNYNRRKNRRGAFWEDRYHAVPIETRAHFFQCLTYVDLNMVRAGVVSHPQDWQWAGYNEIQRPRNRYRIIDLDRLLAVAQVDSLSDLQISHRSWVSEKLSCEPLLREPQWTTLPASNK
ncbi:MAG: transposase [Gammaproteobacteria bacterium]